MSENNPPSYDPVDLDTITGMFRQVLDKFLQNVDDCLPARVISYDRETNRAQVQPLVKILTTDDVQVSRASIASVPVLVLGGGGYVLSFPLKANDLGWIKASDRDISLFLQGYKEAAPNTLRKHSFSDAVFIPDVMRGYTIDAEDDEAVVLQSLDGTARVSLSPERVKVSHPVKITLDAPMTETTGAFHAGGEITGAAGIAVATFISWAAGLATGTAAGDLTAPGTITGDTDVASGDITLKTHLTSGVTAGTGTSGAPVAP